MSGTSPEEELVAIRESREAAIADYEAALQRARVEGARAMLASAAGRLRAKFDPEDRIHRAFVAAASEIETMGDDATVNAAIREAGLR